MGTHEVVRCSGTRQRENETRPEPPMTIDSVYSHGEEY